MFVSRNTSIVIDILANSFRGAITIAKNKQNKFPIIIDDNKNGWAKVDNGEIVSATNSEYLTIC